VIAIEGDVGRGSVRGPRGSRLYDAVAAGADLLERFGGHQAAAGLDVRADRIAAFRQRFVSAIAEQAAEATRKAEGSESSIERSAPGVEEAVLLHASDSPALVLRDLFKLEPCGEGNPIPKVGLIAEIKEAREVKGGHLKLELAVPCGDRIGGFAVGLGAQANALPREVLVVGSLRPNRFRGSGAVEIYVDSIRARPDSRFD
jgi:single-stranded-DNA-specific exonuclease